jgi:hypothetical protein
MKTKIVSCLTNSQANKHLEKIGMKIGEWNQITTPDVKELNYLNYKAPSSAKELENFASHVAGWLASGTWKMFQIDNSSYLDATQAYTFSRLLFGTDEPINFVENGTFLFEFNKEKYLDRYTEVLISNLIHLFLLYECHGQIVTLDSLSRQILSIQDGFIYFISDADGLLKAKTLMENFESNPLSAPHWVVDFIIDTQE